MFLHPAPLNFSTTKFDTNNGARGIIPVTPMEWKHVGIDTDVARPFSFFRILQANTFSKKY